MNRPSSPIRTAPWPSSRAAAAAVLLAGAVHLLPAWSATEDGRSAGKAESASETGRATAAPRAPTSAPRPVRAAPAGPLWASLSQENRAALAPLAPHWNGFTEDRKRKWMAMIRDFRTLSPEEQARMHGRMADWVALSPRERAEARFNFSTTQERLSSDTRKARWESYQALSDDEKQRLAASAPPAPAKGVATPAHAPAAAPAPVRLVAAPAAAVRARAPAAETAVQRARIQHNTLLPERAAPGTPAQAPRDGAASP